jgi:hypothetical protein
MRKIWKRSITIYTDYDPQDVDIEDLAREAMTGNGYFIYQDEELDDPSNEVDLVDSEFYHQCFEEDQDDDDE